MKASYDHHVTAQSACSETIVELFMPYKGALLEVSGYMTVLGAALGGISGVVWSFALNLDRQWSALVGLCSGVAVGVGLTALVGTLGILGCFRERGHFRRPDLLRESLRVKSDQLNPQHEVFDFLQGLAKVVGSYVVSAGLFTSGVGVVVYLVRNAWNVSTS